MKPERVLALILVAVCAPLYISHTITVMRPNDPTGYVYAGMRIRAGAQPTYRDDNDALVGPYFSLNAFKVRIGQDESVSYLNYSPGLPLLLAAGLLSVPVPTLIYYVVPCMGVIGVAATFALGNVLVNARVGLLSAILVAFSPIYLKFGTETWSDVPAMTFVLLGSTAMIISIRRHRLGWGLMAGCLLGYAFLIRYPNVVVLLPLGLYVCLEHRLESAKSKGVQGLLLGLGLAMLAVLLFNRVYYGGFLTTGYTAKHGWAPWAAFSLEYLLGDTPKGAGTALLATGETLLSAFAYSWPLMVVGLLLMPRRTGAFLAGICIAFIAPYSVYRSPARGINSRLLMTVFPAVAIMIAYGVERTISLVSAPRGKHFALALGLALTLVLSLPPLPSALAGLRKRNEWAARRVQWTVEFTACTDPNSVFVSSEYDDWVRVYGHRSALNPTRVAVPDASGEGYDERRFEPALIAAVDTLLSNEIPVYYIDDRVPEHMSFMHTYEVLSRHYELSIYRDRNPTVYEIKSKQL